MLLELPAIQRVVFLELRLAGVLHDPVAIFVAMEVAALCSIE